MQVDIVIPVLDEAARIRAQLEHAVGLPGVGEVIVVDGGSTDGTVSIARAVVGVRVIMSARGRGRQLNAGARASGGEAIVFLHADVRLPDDAVERVRGCLCRAGVVGGAFRTRHVPDGRRSWADPLLRLADLRCRYTRFPYGDQAVFVTRVVFERLGGFPDLLVFEDLEFSRRLWSAGQVEVLRSEVEVSARRFQERPVYHALLSNLMPALYRVGVPASLLARLWRPIR